MQTQRTTSPYSIRRLRPEDFDRWAQLCLEYDREAMSADHRRKRLSEWQQNDPRIDLTAEAPDGRAVGFGTYSHREHHADRAFFMSMDVDPEFQGQGIGAAMLALFEEYGAANGATIVTAFVREGNADARRFMEKRGYPKERDVFRSALNLEHFSVAPFADQLAENRGDLQIRSWEELGDTPEHKRRLYEMSRLSDTAPDMDIWGFPDQDQFELDMFGSPWFTPDCLLIAECDGSWAGLHTSGPTEKGSTAWTTDYTGVVPEFRGRGIGMALKLRGLQIAQAAGGKDITTHNDSENRWMLAINEQLGFQRQQGWWQMRMRK